MSDEEVIEHLTQVKGIGVWTAHMFLIFSLRRPNVLPTGDYGVQMALKKHYRNANCQSRKTWRRSRARGSHIAASPAGTCGAAWISKHFSARAGHTGELL